MESAFEYDVPLADATSLVCDAWRTAWMLPARVTVSQWADQKRVIAPGAGAEPGPWRTARTPYLREVMDSLSEHLPVREVSFQKSAQIGATEVLINWAGYVIDHAPDAMIVAQPVKDLARSWATAKFEPALALMPAVAAKVHANNTLEKSYPGGTLWVIWANSSNQLRQRTARYLGEDELDEYPDDLSGQGSADEQLEARPLSFGDRGKIYRACTPTVDGKSKIAKRYDEGDRREYLLPCPECGTHFALSEELLQPNGTFACPGCGVQIAEHHKTAMLRERSPCPGCGDVPVRQIERVDGARLVFADECGCGKTVDPPAPDGAFWCPRNPDADRAHRSYFVWAAYTPPGLGLTWQEIAERRAEAASDHSKQAGFYNLILGLPFAGERQSQDATEVGTLAEPGLCLGIVPAGYYLLTAGVDCQHDRFEVQVFAHGRGQRAVVVDYQVIDGDPSMPDGYDELDAYLARVQRTHRGMDMPIAAVAIDGGNWTEQVAQFVKRVVSFSGNARLIETARGYQPQKIYVVRGRSEKKSQRAVYRPSRTEINAREKTVARSVGVWGVGTSVLKHQVYGWLSSALAKKAESEKLGDAEPIERRMLRFPGGRGEPFDPLNPDPGALRPDYFRSLTCEVFDLELQQWIKPKGARNEALDTAVYALWAALSPAVKIDMMREPQWEALERLYDSAADDLFAQAPHGQAPATQPARAEPAANKAPSPAAAPRARSGWGTGSSSRGWK